jgi:hypothetical protein
VPSRKAQQQALVSVLQNHSPEYIVIDEIGTQEEAEAAWSISQRGIRMIATCHGENLPRLLQNKALNLLVGGAAQAFLSNEERRLRNKVRKTILERPYLSPFDFVVEIHERDRAHVYTKVNEAVDYTLDGRDPHSVKSLGRKVSLREQLPEDMLKLTTEDQSEAPEENTLSVGCDNEGYTSVEIDHRPSTHRASHARGRYHQRPSNDSSEKLLKWISE